MNDLMHSLRLLRRYPGTSSLVILSLVIGITLNTVIFSVVDWAWLRPSPFAESRDVVRLFANSEHEALGSFSYPDYREIRDGMRSVTGLAAVEHRGATLRGQEYSEMLLADVVSRNYFDVLGVGASIGEVFSDSDPEDLKIEPLVVISHGLWQRHFNASPDLVGRSVLLTGRSVTVMGIAPKGFTGTRRMVPSDVWFPVDTWGRPQERATREVRSFELIGRLREGYSFRQAEAEAEVIFSNLELREPESGQEERALVLPDARFQNRRYGMMSLLLLGIVGAVLLIACANVSGVLLARAMVRQREMAIRISLGGRPGRLVRQLLTEGLVLAVISVAICLVLSGFILRLLPALLPPTPVYMEWGFSLDGRVIEFTVVIALLTTLLFGLIPALSASRPELIPMLRGELTGSGDRRKRIRGLKALVAGQLALALVLVSTTGLLLRSYLQYQAADPGFEKRDVLLVNLLPPGGETEGRRFYGELLDRLRTVPGVSQASLARHVPFGPSGGGATRRVFFPEGPGAVETEGLAIKYNIVDPSYFGTLGIRIARGRSFTAGDDHSSEKVILINETMADRFWPGEEPLGKTIYTGGLSGEPLRVVGIVADGKYNRIDEPPEPYIYFPFAQAYSGEFTLLVGSTGITPELTDAVRREIREADREVDFFRMSTLEETLRYTLYMQEMIAELLSFFALVGLVLAGVGLYGVIAYAVSRRTHEIGVRMALGATAGDVLRMVLRQSGALALIGIAIGLPVALTAALLLRGFLFEVPPLDPVSFLLSLVVLTGVTLLATYIPGRRALKVDPISAIQYE